MLGYFCVGVCRSVCVSTCAWVCKLLQWLYKYWIPSGNELLYCRCYCKHTPILSCLLTNVIYLNSIYLFLPPSLSSYTAYQPSLSCFPTHSFSPFSNLPLFFHPCIVFLPPTHSIDLKLLHFLFHLKLPHSQLLSFHPHSSLSPHPHFSHSLLLSAAQHQCAVYRAGDCPSRDTVSCTTADLHCNIP